MKCLTIFFLMAIVLLACGKTHNAEGDNPIVVRRSGTTLTAVSGKAIDLTTKRLCVSLLFDGTAIKPGNGSAAPIMTCVNPLDPEMQIGEVKCDDGATKAILAKHVTQVCSFNGQRIKASGDLSCHGAQVYIYQLSPQLGVFTENK